jgi:hypothetical protein
MANGFDRAFNDLFGSGRADRGMGISDYAPAFGAEELASVEAVRPRITGTPRAQVGQTGFYGRALDSFGRGVEQQAAASGDLASAARGAKNAAQIAADIQIGRDRRAADTATQLAQSRARQNIMKGIGGVAEAVRAGVESAPIQVALQKASENRADRKAFGRDMAELQAPIDESVREMERMATTLRPDSLARLRAPSLDHRGDELAGAPMGTTEAMLARIPRFGEGRDIQGDSDRAYIAAIEEQASRDAYNKYVQEQRGLQAQDLRERMRRRQQIEAMERAREAARSNLSYDELLSVFGGE